MANLVDPLKALFAEVLLCRPEHIDPTQPYVDMGVDSILAIQLTQLIHHQLKLEITPADLFRETSIDSLARFLDVQISSEIPVQPPSEVLSEINPTSEKTAFDAEDIVITGMSGRFSGAETLSDYWDVLIEGRCTLRTSHRFGAPQVGGFLESIDLFDSDFFSISPKEALLMDPQQRLLLEVAAQAFADAGYALKNVAKDAPEALKGKRCGVFATSLPGDYRNLLKHHGAAAGAFPFLGNAASVVAGRIAYAFDFKGPALYVDTACSSGLVALHLAVQHLQKGLCDLALVAGSTLFSTQELFDLAASARMLSPSGGCHPFDARADGFVPAEGVACLVLERLPRQQAFKKSMYGTVVATGIGHDGRTNGLMSPSPDAQAELLNTMYETAHINPRDIAHVETHGTGTPIGDPLEIQGLLKVFQRLGVQEKPFLGASKGNIGHTLVTSGLASVIKTLLSFQQGVIPGHPSFETLNPHITLGGLRFPTQSCPWPENKRLACVSAFGFSGTNAHVVLKKPTAAQTRTHITPQLPFQRKRYWIDDRTSQGTAPRETVQQRNFLEILRQRLASLLDYPEKDLDPERPLQDYGLDSLIALQLLEPFTQTQDPFHIPLQIPLGPQCVFEHPTLRALALFLEGKEKPAIAQSRLRTICSLPETRLWEGGLSWIVGQKSGVPLVLLSPLNTRPEGWIQQCRFFGDRGFQVHIPLYPGHSQTPYTGASLTTLSHLILSDLSNLVASQSVHGIGWSLGGCLALSMSTFKPGVFKSLTLVSTAACFESDLFSESTHLRKELVPYEGYFQSLLGEHHAHPSSLLSAGCSLDILAAYYGELQVFDVRASLESFATPVQLIHGAQDVVIHQKDVDRLSHIPGAQIQVWKDHGHFIPLTAPYAFNKSVEAFMQCLAVEKGGEEVHG